MLPHESDVPLPQNSATRSKVFLMRHGVIVAGMHRSGTSAMTRVLNLLGCALPEDLIGPNLGNDQGHWESSVVVALNDEILAAAGSSWDDWAALNPDWRASPLRGEAVDKATEIVRQHGRIGPLFVMKDPRVSKLADIWLEACDAAEVSPAMVIALRNPVEVSSSLERRDLMTPAYGHLLWLRYMLDVEHYSRGRKRVVCRFDQLLGNWSAVVEQIRSGTGLCFPRNSPLVHNEIDQFIDTRGRHHEVRTDFVTDNPNLSTWLRQTYVILHKWSLDGEDASDFAELDAIRSAFDESAPAFSRLILPGSHSGLAGSGQRLKLELEEQLDHARMASAEASRVTHDSMARLQEAQSREEMLGVQLQERAQLVQQLESEISALHAEVAQAQGLAATVEQLQAIESQLRAQIAEFQHAAETAQIAEAGERDARAQAEQQIAAFEQAVEAMQQEQAAERGAREQAEQQLKALKATAKELETQQLQSITRVEELEWLLGEANHFRERDRETWEQAEQQLKAQQAQSAARIGELEHRLAEASERQEGERAVHARTEEELVRALESLSQAREELGDVASRLATAESALIQRREELAQLWEEIQSSRMALAEMGTLRQELTAQEATLAATRETLLRLKAEQQAALRAEEAARAELTKETQARCVAQAQLDLVSEQLSDAQWKRDREAEVELAARSAAERQLEARFSEVALLTKLLRDVTAERDTARTEALGAQQTENTLTLLLQKRDEDVALAEVARRAAERELSGHFSEVTKLTQMLREVTAELDATRALAQAGRQAKGELTESLLKRDEQVGAAEVVRGRAERQLADHASEATRLSQQSREAIVELADAKGRPGHRGENELTELLQKRDEQVGAAEAARSVAERQLSARFAEIATLTKLLRDSSVETDASKAQSQWLRRVNAVTSDFPRWWIFMPANWRRRHEHARYTRKGLFDAEKYLRLYPDVAASGMDPLKHYILHGMDENRRNPV